MPGNEYFDMMDSNRILFDGILTATQLQTYHQNGYLVIPDYFTKHTADQLKLHADSIIQSIDVHAHPRIRFNDVATSSMNKNALNSSNDKYFLDSADSVGVFFESKSIDSSGKLIVEPNHAFNKIGHSLHIDDVVFRQFTIHQKICNTTKSLLMVDPIILQSMLIFKHPYIGGSVDIHRDCTFLYTEPSSCVGFWYAITSSL